MDLKEKAKKTFDILEKEFPGASIALEFANPLELLIATILSAQATDKLVNRVTAQLFRKYKTAGDYAGAELPELEKDLSSINFYRNKAKNVKGCCEKLVKEYGGRVPETLDALVTLPGVGRKTANVVRGNAFGKDALAVDTHVMRVSRRIGLTKSDEPDDIEQDLCRIISKGRWTETTRLFILHGRNICKARNPACPVCPVSGLCDYYKTELKLPAASGGELQNQGI